MTSVLKDGKQLSEYLLDLNVRVTTSATYELKQVDSDHFTEE
jgi:restriction endonuclease Mrr